MTTTQIFKEFIQFAYAELQTPGWTERNGSISNIYGGFNTLYEFQVHESDEERKEEVIINVVFRGMIFDGYWFMDWFYHTYPERIWMMGPNIVNGCEMHLHDEFGLFVRDLSYEELMDIIEIDMISLK